MTDLQPDVTPGTTAGSPPAAPRCGCPDLTLSRRRFLGGVAAGTGALATANLFGDAFRQVAYGAPGDNVVVVLSMRGGSDGLSIVVPKNDIDFLIEKRPLVHIPLDRLVGGNGSWGLHPAMAPLVPMWDAGTFGAVHGVGLPQPNRSHFEAMELVEEANPGSSSRIGWINRVIGTLPDPKPEEHVQLGSSMLPTALQGPAPALGAYGVNDLQLPSLWNDEALSASLKKAWGGKGTSLNAGVETALSAVGRLKRVSATNMEPILDRYPDGPLRSVLANTATLIKDDVGARMITIDYGDWDMHFGMGTPEPGGWMYDHLQHFAESIVAFFADLGPTFASRVTVVTISEFGRRVEQNGTSADESGLDHGYGNAMLLFGAGVNGGDVRGGGWRPLSDDTLNEGDVPMIHDYRSVLAEVIANRHNLSGGQLSAVFPGFSRRPVGIMAWPRPARARRSPGPAPPSAPGRTPCGTGSARPAVLAARPPGRPRRPRRPRGRTRGAPR